MSRFALTYLVVLAIPLLIFFLFFRFSIMNLLQAKLEAKVDYSLGEVAVSITSEFAQLDDLLVLITTTGDFTRPNLNDPIDLIGLQDRLQGFVIANDCIKEMAYFPIPSERVFTSLSPRFPHKYFLALAEGNLEIAKRTAQVVAGLQKPTVLSIISQSGAIKLLYASGIPTYGRFKRGWVVFETHMPYLRRLLSQSLPLNSEAMLYLIADSNVIMTIGSIGSDNYLSEDYNQSAGYLVAEKKIENYELELRLIVDRVTVDMEINRSLRNLLLITFIILTVSFTLIYLFSLSPYSPLKKLAVFLQETFRGEILRGGIVEIAQKQIGKLLSERAHLSKEVDRSREVLRREYLNMVLTGNIENWNLVLERGARLGLELTADSYRVIVFSSEVSITLNTAKDLERIFINFLGGTSHVFHVIDFKEGDLVILAALSSKNTQSLDHALDEFTVYLEKERGYRWSVAVSTPIFVLKDIPKGYLEAKAAHEYRFVRGFGEVIRADQVLKRHDSFSSFPSSSLVRISNYMRFGAARQAIEEISGIFSALRTGKPSLFLARCVSYDLITTLIESISEVVKYRGELWEYTGTIDLASTRTLKEMETFIIKLVNDLHSIRKKNNAVSHRGGITSPRRFDLIIDYIIEHTSDKNLSVKAIASEFGLSVSNFSHRFKRRTGQTFMEYITGIRIEQSKNLLSDTDANLTNIVDCIGFGQVNSFIRRFRRETGITPMEYRRRNSNGTLRRSG